MKKLLILTMFGMGLLIQSSQATISDLEGIIPVEIENTTTGIPNVDHADRAALLICMAIKGNGYKVEEKVQYFDFKQENKITLKRLIIATCNKYNLPRENCYEALFSVLFLNKLHFQRSGVNYTVSDNEGNSVSFKCGTLQQLQSDQ